MKEQSQQNTPKTPAHSLNKVYWQNKGSVVPSTHIHTLTFTYNAELLTLLSQKLFRSLYYAWSVSQTTVS